MHSRDSLALHAYVEEVGRQGRAIESTLTADLQATVQAGSITIVTAFVIRPSHSYSVFGARAAPRARGLQYKPVHVAIPRHSLLFPSPGRVVGGSSRGAHNRAHGTSPSTCNIGMLHNLPLVMSNLRLGDGADRIVGLALGGGVVGRQDGRDGPNDGADLVVQLLGLGLVNHGLEGRAF